jgi:hypothetical protein
MMIRARFRVITSRDELAHRPKPRGELLLCEGEVHREAYGHRAARFTGGRGDVVREPLVHRAEGKTARHIGEATHAPWSPAAIRRQQGTAGVGRSLPPSKRRAPASAAPRRPRRRIRHGRIAGPHRALPRAPPCGGPALAPGARADGARRGLPPGCRGHGMAPPPRRAPHPPSGRAPCIARAGGAARPEAGGESGPSDRAGPLGPHRVARPWPSRVPARPYPWLWRSWRDGIIGPRRPIFPLESLLPIAY